mmetsp:Transcript_25137/g.31530  ORF Transcript_25137/g.31530 Transcript_25137/m.31530 type:complete len:93 (+) Transcript_25137:1367-1645(+)
MILNDAERAFKTRVWKAQNSEYLKAEREKKRERKEAKKMEKMLQGTSSPLSSHNPLSLQDAESNLLLDNKEQAVSVVSDKLSELGTSYRPRI